MKKKSSPGNSLVVSWLGLCFPCWGPSSITDQVAKIAQAMKLSQKKKIKKKSSSDEPS